MKVLITGGAGFIGSHLSEALLKKGVEVYIIDNFNSYYNSIFKRKNVESLLKNNSFKLLEGDVTNIDFLNSVFKKKSYDKVVHLAASVGVRYSLENPQIYHINNIKGTRNILDLVGRYKIPHFLFASSSSVYGNSSPIPFSENMIGVENLNPYMQTKKEGEELCKKHGKHYGTKITIFRFFTVYGVRGRPDMSPYIFTKSILEDKEIKIFGDGKQKRDFTNINDLIKGVTAGMEKKFKFETINLGGSSPIELLKFISIIEKVTGKKAKLKFSQENKIEMRDTYADIQKARRLLGFNPSVSLEKGLREFVEWFKNNRLTFS